MGIASKGIVIPAVGDVIAQVAENTADIAVLIGKVGSDEHIVKTDAILLKGLPQTSGAPAGYGDLASAVNFAYPYTKPEILRRFTDTTGVTITKSGGNTSTTAIDQSSPFGGAALKVDLVVAGAGSNIEIGLSGLNIANFDGNIVYKVWIDDYTKVGQVFCYAGTTNYTRFYQQTYNLTSSGQLYNGARLFSVGELHKAQSGTFVAGTDTLDATRIRFQNTTAATTVWVQACLMPRKNRGIICLSYDDGFEIWKTRVIPKLNQYGFKAGLAIEQSRTNTPNNLTSNDLLEFAQQGHLLVPHQVTNTRFDDQNDSTGQALAPYMDDFTISLNSLRGWTTGVGSSQYNAYVQGRFNQSLIDAMTGRGLRCGRSVVRSYDHYSCGMGAELFGMKTAYLDPVDLSVDNVKSKVDLVSKYGCLMFIMGHNFSTDGSSGPSLWPIEFHDEVIDYVAQKVASGEIVVIRPDQLVQYVGENQ